MKHPPPHPCRVNQCLILIPLLAQMTLVVMPSVMHNNYFLSAENQYLEKTIFSSIIIQHRDLIISLSERAGGEQ